MAHSNSNPKPRLIFLEHGGLFVTGTTAFFAALSATVGAIVRPRNPMMGGVQGACLGFIYSSGVVGMLYLRQKEDKWNDTIPVTVATTVDYLAFLPRRRFPVAASRGVLLGGVTFCALSLLDKYHQNNSVTPPQDGNQFIKPN